MDKFKSFSKAVGNATQAVKICAQEFSDKNDLKGKSDAAKASIKSTYEQTIGRNAEIDKVAIKLAGSETANTVQAVTAPAISATKIAGQKAKND